MPTATITHLSHFNIKLDGQQDRDLINALLDCTVENSLHLPDACSFRLHDAGFKWLDSDRIKEGTHVEVTAGEENTANLQTIFQGEVTALEMDLAAHGVPTLVARCFDRSHRLHRGRQCRSFVQAKDVDVVGKVAAAAGFTVHADDTSQVHEWLFQNNQTDWEFLTERAAHNGFRLFVAGDKDLYFKKVGDQAPGCLSLEWGKDLRSFRPHTTMSHQVDEVVVKGWDPKSKQPIVGSSKRPSATPQIGDAKAGGDIANSAFGAARMVVADRPVHTQAEADDLARSICDDIGGAFIEADGLCFGQPMLKPGMQIEVKNIGKRFSGKYLVTTTTHTYTPAEGYATMFCVHGKSPQNLLSLIHGDGGGKRTQLGGNIVVGLVTDNQDPEGMGRVKVKYPWLTEDHTSYWARQCSPMAGPERGFYFLPEVDDEVLMAFEHGDVRRPYIIGHLWNGKDKPVEPNSTAISAGKVNRRTIKTRIGHTLLFDDKDGKGEIRLQTAAGHVATLDDAHQNITLKTKTGHTVVLDDQGSKIEMVDSTGANKITISSSGQSIDMTCLGSFSLSALQGISLTTSGSLTINSSAAQINCAGAYALELSAAAVTCDALTVTAGTIPINGVVTVQGAIIQNGIPVP